MSGVQGIVDAVKGIGDKIKSFLHFSVPDEGPLTDYESWMPDFMGGLAEGISSNEDTVLDKVKGLAEEIAEITEHMVSLFGLWDYGKVVPYLLIAVYRKDVEKCIQLIKEVLMESQKPWKMVESPLYYRYADTVQGKSFSGVGNNFVRALATEIENKEEYEFLKGNKELEAIFSQYLK